MVELEVNSCPIDYYHLSTTTNFLTLSLSKGPEISSCSPIKYVPAYLDILVREEENSYDPL